MRRLLLVSHRPLDYGGGGAVRWNYFREALPEHGWEVELVTARPNITANEFAADPRAARVAAARARVMATVGRVARPVAQRALGIQPEAAAPSIAWSVTGRRPIRRALEATRPAVVVATGPPPAAMFAAATEAGRAQIPFVVEFRDLWAGNSYYDAGGALLRRLEERPLADAAAVIAVTDGARGRLAELHPALASRIHVLPNGFDPRLLAMRADAPGATDAPAAEAPGAADAPRELVHAGGIYGDRSLDALLAALRRPELAGQVRLTLIGPGGNTAASGAHVLAPMPAVDALQRVAGADIALVIRTPGDDTAIPGKAYEALALGKPILALVGGDSELRRLLESLGQDRGCADAEDADDIAAALTRLLADPPAPVDPERLERYDRARTTAGLATLLDAVAR